jgi:hypothetical protein
MDSLQNLLCRRDRILQKIPPMDELIRGSLVERHLRCGKSGCHCARGKGHRVWYLTVSFAGGKTEQVTVPKSLLPVVRRWVANYHRWWDGMERISAINRDLLRKRWVDPLDKPQRMGKRGTSDHGPRGK